MWLRRLLLGATLALGAGTGQRCRLLPFSEDLTLEDAGAAVSHLQASASRRHAAASPTSGAQSPRNASVSRRPSRSPEEVPLLPAPGRQVLAQLQRERQLGTSATFRCQQLMPFGSWAVFSVLCMLLNLGICNCMGLCHESKAGGSSRTCGLQPRSFAFLISFFALALQCLAMSRCLQGHLEFLHIPKNGGTAIELAGKASHINWGMYNVGFRFGRQMPDGHVCSSYHAPPRHMRGLTPYLGAEVFCVVRHPYERALSEYTYLLAAKWAQSYADTFRNGLFDKPTCTAEGLNHFVQRTLRLYRRGQKYIDNCHHVPQSEFIWDADGKQICVDILRQDELSDDFNRLMGARGYPVELPPEHKNSESSFCPDLTVDALTGETRDLLRLVYKDDFRLLNYTAW